MPVRIPIENIERLPLKITERLPTEITEGIIGFLHDDKAGLSACSLVCKVWSTRSRHLLFREVFLVEKNCHQFLSLSVGKPYLGSLSFEHFIEHLHINTSADRSARHRIPKRRKDEKIRFRSHCIISQLSAHMPNLKSLRISYIGFSKIHVLQLLSSFPLLEEIYIDSNCWGEDQDNITFSDIRKYDVPRGLRVVDVWWCTTPPIVDWIHSRENVPPVQRLSLRCLSSDELQSTGECLRALGASLLDLVLDFCINFDVPTAGEYAEHINLNHNTELRSITFFNVGCESQSLASVAAFPRVLASITSLHLETINLILSGSMSQIFGLLEYRLLETILNRPQFEALQTIRFEFPRSEALEEEGCLRNSLPECDARKILVIERQR